MSLKEMQARMQSAGLSKGQETWWPRWLERYAVWTRQKYASKIEVREDALIDLLRTMRDDGGEESDGLDLGHLSVVSCQ